MDAALLQKSPLFDGITTEEIERLLHCLGGRIKRYAKGDFIFHAGTVLRQIGLVVSGKVQVVKEDYWGGRLRGAVFRFRARDFRVQLCLRVSHAPHSQFNDDFGKAQSQFNAQSTAHGPKNNAGKTAGLLVVNFAERTIAGI